MVQKVEEIVEYIIKNLDGTDEDNCFINALAYVAQVQLCVDEISLIELDSATINEKIEDIYNYIKNPKTIGIVEINKIFGFITDNFDFNCDDGNYYLFIANVKIKAMAFLCRTYSFIKKYERHEESEWEYKLKSARSDVTEEICAVLEKENLIKHISIKCQTNQQEKELNEYKIVKNRIVEKSKEDNGKTEYCKLTKEQACDFNLAFQIKEREMELSQLERITVGRITELLGIENKVEDIEIQKEMAERIIQKSENRSLRYFIFDNSMREVEFFGIENRFNWLWESESNVCLYRNVVKKEKNANTYKFETQKGMDYMKELMTRIVSHASGDYNEAISYSRNPIRDIYKYLDLNHDVKPLEIVFTINVNGEQVSLDCTHCFNENETATFEFIEKATTNKIRTSNDGLSNVKESSFYEYLKLSEDNYSNTKYCIEFCKENTIVPYSKGRRLIKLNNYLHTWGIDKNFMYSHVSDNDDEVITSIDYFTDDEKKIYKLNFIDILVILYKIYSIEGKADVLTSLKERITREYKEQLKNINIEREIILKGGVTVKINTPEDMNETIQTKVIDKKNMIPEKIAGIIIDIIKQNEGSKNVANVISAIKQGIEKDKNRYQFARTEEFKLFVEQNKILSFWKQLFKGL